MRATRAASSGRPATSARAARSASSWRRTTWSSSGSFLPLQFSRDDGFAADMRSLEETLGVLADASEGRERPVVLLSDAFCEPDRMRYAGAIEAHPETWLGERRQRLLFDNMHRAAELCRERGFVTSFHPHAGTYIETPREVEALLERMDTSLLGLCFDTGHSAFGGGNPLALLREAGELVNHVHFKDVDLELLARLHAEGKGLEEAWAAGVFCELGTGGAQVDECLAASARDRLRPLDRGRAGSHPRAR